MLVFGHRKAPQVAPIIRQYSCNSIDRREAGNDPAAFLQPTRSEGRNQKHHALSNTEGKELEARISDAGPIHYYSVVHRHAMPTAGTDTDGTRTRRAPFYQWRSKVNDKTVYRTLGEEESTLYREWIENDRELRQIIKAVHEAYERASRTACAKRLTSKLSCGVFADRVDAGL